MALAALGNVLVDAPETGVADEAPVASERAEVAACEAGTVDVGVGVVDMVGIAVATDSDGVGIGSIIAGGDDGRATLVTTSGTAVENVVMSGVGGAVAVPVGTTGRSPFGT